MDTDYLKKVGLYILSAILSIGLVVYLGYHIWQSFSTEVETLPAQKITYEQVIETSGVIFRTEKLIENTSNAKSVIPSAREGEHIRKSGEVARLYSEFSPDTVSRISQIEDQIALLSTIRSESGMSLQDTAKTDKEIFSVLSMIREYSSEGNATKAVELRKELISAVSKRALLTGSYSDIDEQITELEKEKAALVGRLGSLMGTVYTPVSGFYYSEADGYEDIFKASLLESITLTDLRSLLSSQPASTQCAGKTVTNSRWYLVCMLDEREKNTYAPGSACKVSFKGNDLSINMDVENVLYDKEGTCVILSTNMMPEGFDFSRNQDVELVKCEYSGIKVPLSAVRMIDGRTGVYILDVSTVSFREINILYKTENYYIAEMPDDTYLLPEEEGADAPVPEEEYVIPLRLYDSIITEGTGLYEGMVVGN